MNKTKINSDLIVINSPQMDNNSYILTKGDQAIIIDPSFAGQAIIDAINEKYVVVGILLTHAHFDHCYDTAKLVSKYKCPVYIHKNDVKTYDQYHYANLVDMKLDRFDDSVKYFTGNTLKVGNFEFEVIPTPGHTQGSVTYKYKDYVFVGDTLFFNSYGRTDLVNSSELQLKRSITHLYSILKDNDYILPGHSSTGLFKEVKKVNWMADQLIKK